MDKNRQLRTPLFSALVSYKNENIIHFDVPGHKKNVKSAVAKAFGKNFVLMDANSTKDLDMLSNPSGVIQEAEILLAEAYGADNAFMLVNGSTFGVIVMIMSVCSPKDKILLPRNAHKSAINGIILSGATPVFLSPEIDFDYGISNGLSLKSVKQAIKNNPDAKALFLLNPTYFGITSDIKEIVKLCHRHGIAVIADEAHGAHFKFNKSFPMSAMEAGADLSTASIHKTGGSLTQSSVLLHKEGLICADKLRNTITLMQTTSASYMLMASIDVARSYLAVSGSKDYAKLLEYCRSAKEEINKMPGLSVITSSYANSCGAFAVDETKFIIKVNELGLTGFEVYDIMKNEYNIQLELAETYVVLAIVGIGDTKETIAQLLQAFNDMSKRYRSNKPFIMKISRFFEKPQTVVAPRDAYYSPKSMIDLNDALGRICGESVMIYPPGIPLIIPGEIITKQVIKSYNFYLTQDCVIMNCSPGKIMVLGLEEQNE